MASKAKHGDKGRAVEPSTKTHELAREFYGHDRSSIQHEH